MAEIFRGLLSTRIPGKPEADHDGTKPHNLVLNTPTVYTAGYAVDWPTPPHVEREQPQIYGVPVNFFPVYIAPPRAYTLMGQACL